MSFTPSTQATKKIGVTTTSSAAIALATSSGGEVSGNAVWLYNEGSQVAYAILGSSSVAAATVPSTTAGSFPVPPGADLLVARASTDTHFRCITASGSTDLCVTVGYSNEV